MRIVLSSPLLAKTSPEKCHATHQIRLPESGRKRLSSSTFIAETSRNYPENPKTPKSSKTQPYEPHAFETSYVYTQRKGMEAKSKKYERENSKKRPLEKVTGFSKK